MSVYSAPMADFRTHVTVSSALGAGLGVAGYAYGLPWDSCLVAAGVCGVAGMLPDLDSDSGVPQRETVALVAAVIPMLMLERFEQLGLSHERMAIAGGLVYLAIRFGAAELFRRYTVHRGMWHSIPAAVIAGLAGFLVCHCPELTVRAYKGGAVFLGFMSHLFLDEFWSLQVRRGKLHAKKSFGSALKFFSDSAWANVSTYSKLAFLACVAFGDPVMMQHLEDNLPAALRQNHHLPHSRQVRAYVPSPDEDESEEEAWSVGRGAWNARRER